MLKYVIWTVWISSCATVIHIKLKNQLFIIPLKSEKVSCGATKFLSILNIDMLHCYYFKYSWHFYKRLYILLLLFAVGFKVRSVIKITLAYSKGS